MNNMITMMYQDKFNNILENSLVYIMDNSKFYKYNKLLFNVSGEINDPQPKLNNKNLILMTNLENDENPETQAQCNISNITRNNYILYCKSNKTFKGELQSAISFIDDNEILLLNFADINESIINNEITQNNRRFYIKNGYNSLGAGAIAGIIIPIVAVIALITFLAFHLRKNNKTFNDGPDSSIKGFKISDGIKY